MTLAAANSPKIKQVGGYLNGTRADSPLRNKNFDVPHSALEIATC
jgi:hypothetical protein